MNCWIIEVCDKSGAPHALAHKDGIGFFLTQDFLRDDVIYHVSEKEAQMQLDTLSPMFRILLDNKCRVAQHQLAGA